ncbi:hypothetical protein TNCV_4187101 [Trichonephila clavipes]|nr:hypothetical protein TNCV_4187101 [Trichonephila clavipes]
MCRNVQSIRGNFSGKIRSPAMPGILAQPAPSQHCIGSYVPDKATFNSGKRLKSVGAVLFVDVEECPLQPLSSTKNSYKLLDKT